MLRKLNNLQRDVLAHLQAHIGGHADLWYTPLARVVIIARACDLEGRYDRMRHIRRGQRSHLLYADVDVDLGFGMPWEPSWLYRERTAGYGPGRAVGGLRHATACHVSVSTAGFRLCAR